jgi:hypothetical protein
MANPTPVAPKTAVPVAPAAKGKPGRPAGSTFTRNPELFNVRLVSTSGKEMIRFTAEKSKATGKYVSFAYHNLIVDKKLQPGQGRGATQEAADFATAKANAEKGAVAAAKLGWIRKQSFGGPGVRADAFDVASIPAPKA